MNDDMFSISFSGLWRVFKKEWLLISFFVFLFTFFGLWYSFSLPEEFVSQGKILPEVQSRGGGGIGQFAGLAALAGVDLGAGSAGTDAIRPDLYPDVLRTTPFYLSLFDLKIKDKLNQETTFKKFYEKTVLQNKLQAKDQKLKYYKSVDFLVNSVQTEKNINDLKQRITCAYDKRSGVISISVKLPDPVVAAFITRYSMDYLTAYIIDYRTSKLKQDLEFLGERLAMAKGKYFNTQERKASYGDRVPLDALRFQAADLQRERIDAEYKTSSNFYNSLLQKYEEAKLKVQQETPVIKVLEPPVVSNFKAEPKKSIIVLSFMVAGVFFSLVFVLVRNKNYKHVFIS